MDVLLGVCTQCVPRHFGLGNHGKMTENSDALSAGWCFSCQLPLLLPHQEHLESILNPGVYQMVTRMAHAAQVTSMISMICATPPPPSDYFGQCSKKLFLSYVN